MIYLYVKTHNITGLKYLGKTIKNPFVYKGSGLRWVRHLKEYGYDVTTEIIYATEDKNDFRKTAIYYSRLWNIVKSNEWANITEEEGQGGNTWDKRGRFISEETRSRMSASAKGKPKSESMKLKLRSLGPRSEEIKKKISMTKKGHPRPTVVCEHCLMKIADVTYNRWHKNNCKSIKTDNS
jgi:hypothetical protein